jgi:hypothetical protein
MIRPSLKFSLSLSLMLAMMGGAEAQPLISNGDFTAPLQGSWILSGKTPLTPQVVNAQIEGTPFARALQLDLVAQADAQPWDVRLGAPSTPLAINKNDLIVVQFWARSTPQTRVNVIYQQGAPTYEKSIRQTATLTPQWQRFTYYAPAKSNYGAGASNFELQLGQATGRLEFAGLKVENMGTLSLADAQTRFGPATAAGGGGSGANSPATPLASSMFPFVIPWDDASKNAVDVSYLNPAPLEEKHRIVARGSHFYDQTGRLVRFLGVNTTFSANFPDKADAEKIAARMHKYGINIVRLHHMDGRKAPMGLWDAKFPDMQHLDADQLDRLDYFVAQLKRNGIYVDLNLHVSRKFTEADGFPEADKLPSNGKVTAWFEPRMIELQKQFARQILTHRNPYTNLTYAQDPVVALIEIHNEDSLLDAARGGQLADLPDYYKKQFVSRWNDFLIQKYGATAALKTAWGNGKAQVGPNLISNSRFAESTSGWTLEQRAPAQGALEVQDIVGEGTVPPGRALQLKTIATADTQWHVQAHYNGLDLQEGQDYTLRFWARANKSRRLTVFAKMDREPWRDVGLRQTITLSPQWKRFELVFNARNLLPQHTRLDFIMGDAVGEVSLADVQLTSGYEMDAKQSLEDKNLDMVVPSTTPWGLDFTRYLMEMERVYADGMSDYIKKDLAARGLVTCSQASYGGLGGVWRESRTDFVDMHAYWQHPYFPKAPWDSKNWSVGNLAMVSDASYGTLPFLAMNRVAGKPFTVSEYNHAAPNSFSAETLPLIMSYAAWQDWDGVFLFDYNGDRNKWSTGKIEGFFSVDSHPGKIAFLPAAAALFLRGTSPQPATTRTLKIPLDQVLPLTASSGETRDVWKKAGVQQQEILGSGLAIQFVPSGKLRVEPSANQSASQALKWFPTEGQFQYASPLAQMAVSNANQNKKVELGDWNYELAKSPTGFAALALFSRDGKPVRQSQSLLLTVAGDVENTNMGWNAERTSVSDKWGSAPVLAEGIAANITLKTTAPKTVIYALDSTGVRTQTVPGRFSNGELQFVIGPQYKTLWYEITSLGETKKN